MQSVEDALAALSDRIKAVNADRNACGSSKSVSRVLRRFRPVVTMIKTPKARSGHNARPKWRAVLDGSSGWRALVQANMSPVLMVVGKVIAPKPPKVIFVQENNMVEQFAARTADPAFCRSILPRAPNARADWLESTGF
jgi:hypothetical protein